VVRIFAELPERLNETKSKLIVAPLFEFLVLEGDESLI
jgi:hypothetical protein